MNRRFASIALIAAGAGFACGNARADCFDEAARYQKVNPLILRAIAWQESHNRPDALNKNTNGSVDYGLMQINSIHLQTLSRYGIGRDTLMEPCKKRLHRRVASAPEDESLRQQLAGGGRLSFGNAVAARQVCAADRRHPVAVEAAAAAVTPRRAAARPARV